MTNNLGKFSSTLCHCKAKSGLQLNSSNTNNSTSVESIFNTGAKTITTLANPRSTIKGSFAHALRQINAL